MKTSDIAASIRKIRKSQKLTQAEFAEKLGTSQSAVTRMEQGKQNFSLEMLDRISEVLGKELISLSDGSTNFVIEGGNKLKGAITVNTSKNAAVGLMCAALLNKGQTTLKNAPKIEEVYRIIEVLESIGVEIEWVNHDLTIKPPRRLKIDQMDKKAASRTRTIIMFLAPLMHAMREFTIPAPGGCDLGSRTIMPHIYALENFGLEVSENRGNFHCTVRRKKPKQVILYEPGDTVTENAIMAAALTEGTTTLKYISANYMGQDVCAFLQACGVRIDGIGSTTLTIHGVKEINKDIEFHIGEDPIEAMTFIAAGVLTESTLTIKRAPIEFVEKELYILEKMGLKYSIDKEYKSKNKVMKLADITVRPSKLYASPVKLHSIPYPGVNMDNLPFMALIAATAHGRTLVHDWSYENRAIYFTELNKLGASFDLADQHRVFVTGPTKWEPAHIASPPALRPSMMIFLAMLAAPGKSILRNVYSINRGYADLANRLNAVGAKISMT
ncbi:TPA: UDP-N-acetylglucosamine 1-carboxyvinyltransferase [Candidatus Saccharibacteria bacterium]|nr:UDP-N-acetylglucosamine 1-carboxyvinyltransferase [Candidatus Saccharibacteria bacterium]HIO88006.1 UDP-N-acetylglucosamine 1-carboxyvinyltransferase [Candidatus Saccharibacteria bacterium]